MIHSTSTTQRERLNWSLQIEKWYEEPQNPLEKVSWKIAKNRGERCRHFCRFLCAVKLFPWSAVTNNPLFVVISSLRRENDHPRCCFWAKLSRFSSYFLDPCIFYPHYFLESLYLFPFNSINTHEFTWLLSPSFPSFFPLSGIYPQGLCLAFIQTIHLSVPSLTSFLQCNSCHSFRLLLQLWHRISSSGQCCWYRYQWHRLNSTSTWSWSHSRWSSRFASTTFKILFSDGHIAHQIYTGLRK